MSDLDALIGRVLTEPDFCDRLIAEPEAVLSEHGVDSTPELVQELRELDPDVLRRLAAAFGKEQAAG